MWFLQDFHSLGEMTVSGLITDIAFGLAVSHMVDINEQKTISRMTFFDVWACVRCVDTVSG